MSKTDAAIQIRLNDVRLSFAQLWHPYAPPPKPNQQPSKPAFQCHFILPQDHSQLDEMKSALAQVAKNQWGENSDNVLRQLIADARVCMRNGNSKTDAEGNVLDGYADSYFVSTRSYVRPTVVNVDRSPLTENDGKPYSGCYVNGIFRIWPQQNNFGKRINAQLMGVQYVRDGESFGGGRVASPEEFDTLSEFAEDSGGAANLIGDDSSGDDDIAF